MTRWFCFVASAVLTALAAPAYAADAQVPTVLHVDVGNDVVVAFELAGKDAVGFTHRQRTSKEERAVGDALQSLNSATDWLRFNAEANCRFSANSIGANLYRAADSDEPSSAPPLTKPVFEVHFTFACEAMPALRSLDLGLIGKFPRVHKVIVDVRTPTSHHAEIVTTPSATVSLTPN